MSRRCTSNRPACRPPAAGSNATARRHHLLAFSLAALVTSAVPAEAARIETRGGRLVAYNDAGAVKSGQSLIGTSIKLKPRTGEALEIRIDAVEPGPTVDIELYEVVGRRSPDAPWQQLCRAGPDGRARVIPIAGFGEIDGGQLSLSCTSGAMGKCVLRGYRPWANGPSGEPLAPYFEACVRMFRADYCGTGQSFTRDGERIALWDDIDINRPGAAGDFEAAWGPKGAVCLRRVRVETVASLTTVLAYCPALAERVRDDCEGWSHYAAAEALIWNRTDSMPLGNGMPGHHR